MTARLWQVDAFAERPFSGNPAAVCLLEREAGEAWMSAIARETMAPGTAFVVPMGAHASIRWFSPHGELQLCGHATLAATHVLAGEGMLDRGSVEYRTRFRGSLRARVDGDDITLDLPADPLQPVMLPDDLGRSFQAVTSWRGVIGYVVELKDADAVRAVAVDQSLLARYPDADLVVTAGGEEHDFISRCFVPGLGEDMVTGSAHCALGPLWASRLGRDEVVGYQASTRGGVVRVRARGERVEVTGRAVTIARGELMV